MRSILALAALAVVASPAFAFGISPPSNIPTLDEVGLLALVGLVGGIGGYLAMRRKK